MATKYTVTLSGRCIRVLFVGPESIEIPTLRDAACILGWRTDVALPASALQCIAGFAPDVVVIDETAVGTEATFGLALRVKTEAGLPVVVITRSIASSISAGARKAGCACISRPCRPGSVMTSISSAIAVAGGRAWRGSKRAAASGTD